MIFNMSGGGAIAGSGSGAGLNFRVVGGTMPPENPRENTIWVNTDSEITSWLFSSTEPTECSDGMVWIYTGTYSTMEFNALKKNGIQVYPLSAKQYINGSWQDKKINSIQNGEWVEWINYLFNKGDQFTDLTGGWKHEVGYAPYNFSFTITESGDMYMHGSGVEEAAHRYGFVYTAKEIDLTNVNYVRCNITQYVAEDPENCRLQVSELSSKASPVAYQTISGRGEIAVDVSKLTGSYAVAFRVGIYNSDGDVSIYADRIWLD